jgi:hypothetical protein
VHDVLNVFMCTGFTRDTHQYFMKASPVKPGDFIEFFAEIDLLGALSACPGGDCSTSHSSDAAKCYRSKSNYTGRAKGRRKDGSRRTGAVTLAVTACKGAPGGWGGRGEPPCAQA